jgi:hypothetical protein
VNSALINRKVHKSLVKHPFVQDFANKCIKYFKKPTTRSIYEEEYEKQKSKDLIKRGKRKISNQTELIMQAEVQLKGAKQLKKNSKQKSKLLKKVVHPLLLLPLPILLLLLPPLLTLVVSKMFKALCIALVKSFTKNMKKENRLAKRK